MFRKIGNNALFLKNNQTVTVCALASEQKQQQQQQTCLTIGLLGRTVCLTEMRVLDVCRIQQATSRLTPYVVVSICRRSVSCRTGGGFVLGCVFVADSFTNYLWFTHAGAGAYKQHTHTKINVIRKSWRGYRNGLNRSANTSRSSQ